mmetsp:Transcript_8755/g.29214  ORF Transcript_8755/g.29214 Transcript_8755/m.29214 type:complete len:200 (-) Transcript_8755:741-1340(-)
MISHTVEEMTSPVLPTPAVMMSRRIRQISSSLSDGDLSSSPPFPFSPLGTSAAIRRVRTSSGGCFPSLNSFLRFCTIGRKGTSPCPLCCFPAESFFKIQKLREVNVLTTRKSLIDCLLRARRNFSCPLRFVNALMNSKTPSPKRTILTCLFTSSVHAMACSVSLKMGFLGGRFSRTCLHENISSENRMFRRIDCDRATQ